MPQFTLTSGNDNVPGTAGPDEILVGVGTLNSEDKLQGGAGGGDKITLVSSDGQSLSWDLSLTFSLLSGFELLQAGDGDDTVKISAANLTQFSALDGGEGPDTLALTGQGKFDLTGMTVTGFEVIVVAVSPSATVVTDSAAQATSFAAAYGSNDTIVLSGASFTLAERAELLTKGFEHVVDASTLFAASPALPVMVGVGVANRPSVTGLADGGCLVTWEVHGGVDEFIYQQRYAADDTAIGSATPVNTTTTGSHGSASVTTLADGGWLVTWRSSQNGTFDIYQRRYDKAGAAVGSEILVNGTTTGTQDSPSVTALADGGWLVTWQSSQGGTNDIYQRRYDKAGAAMGTETLVNGTTTGTQDSPSVTTLADGGWLVTWQSSQGGTNDVYQRRYDKAGAAVGSETLVNGTTTGTQAGPSVTTLADGGWVVTWHSNQDGTNDIYQRRYDQAGAAVGGEILVNATTTNQQDSPSVTGLADGGWLVTWQSFQGGTYDIYQQRYAADGTAVGGEILVNASTTGLQTEQSVTALADGGWVVTWKSNDGVEAIYRRVYRPGATAGSDTVVGSNADEVLTAAPGTLTGGDNLNGGGGTDTLQLTAGGTYDLTLPFMLSGFESLRGSAGADAVTVASATLAAFTTLDGDAGSDTLIVKGSADLSAKTMTGFETLQLASAGALTLSAANLADVTTLQGSAGQDTLILKESADLSGKMVAGFETLQLATAGTLTLAGANLTDVTTLQGAGGGSTLIVAGSADLSGKTVTDFEALQGSAGDDTVTLDAALLDAFATVDGGQGTQDTLVLNGSVDLTGKTVTGFETLKLGAAGTLTLAGASLADILTLQGSAGDDTLVVTGSADLSGKTVTGFEALQGSAGNDSLTLDAAALAAFATLDGGQGTDTLVVKGSADLSEKPVTNFEILQGSAGDDILTLDAAALAAFAAFAGGGGLDTLVLSGDPAGFGFSGPALSGIETVSAPDGALSEAQIEALFTKGVGEVVYLVGGVETTVVNAGPTAILGVPAAVAENVAPGSVIATLSAEDATVGDAHIFTLAGDASGLFEIVGGNVLKLKDGLGLDAEAALSHTLFIDVEDKSHNKLLGYEVTIGVGDIDEFAPTVSLAAAPVRELAPAGTLVGTLAGDDADATGNPTCKLLDDAGGRFALTGDGRIVVRDGIKLDYEQARTHTIEVEVASQGKTVTKVFTIAVGDAAREVTAGSVLADTLVGGKGNDTLGGGTGNDLLKGGAGADILKGDAGNDILFGGLGKDTLTGGKGRDAFAFDTAPAKANVDRVTDFSVKDDSLYLDNAVFKALGKAGSPAKPAKLKKDFFHVGKAAADKGDHVIYDKATGALYYDADGLGGKAQIQIAALKKGLALTAADVFVI